MIRRAGDLIWNAAGQFLYCLLLVVLVGGSLMAQTLPPLNADDQLGSQSFQSYHGGDIDHIGLANGTLTLDSPFLSYSQRGQLHLDFHLYYNNQPQHIGQLCIPNPPPNTPPCFLRWGFSSAPPPLPVEKGDVFVGWAQQIALVGANSKVVFNAGLSDQFQKDFTRWSVQTADGASHILGNLGTQSFTGTSPEFFASGTGPWESLDATGWRFNGTLTTDSGESSSQRSASGAVSADGIVAGVQDTNGNIITTVRDLSGIAPTSFTDTLNRQIPGPPMASSASNTDTSACPGPPQVLLPVDHAVLWSVPGPNGGTSNYVFCYVKVNINIPSGPGNASGQTLTSTKLQSIVLPDGSNWGFQYNDPGDGSTNNNAPVNYGTLTQITLPTGGTISYTYVTTGAGSSCQNSGRFVASRTINANDGTGPHTWTYAYSTTSTGDTSSPLSVATTVTDPLNNQTVHTFKSLYAQDNCPAYETQTAFYQGSQSSGTLMKTVNTTYSFTPGSNRGGALNVVPTQITTTLSNGEINTVSKSYDSGFSYTNYGGGSGFKGLYGKELSESASDYGSSSAGATLRTTNTGYLAFSNSSYLNANLINLVSSQQVTDGSGTQVAKTTYGYDESPLQGSGITTQFGTAPNSVRGNLTSVNRWLNTTSSNITAQTKWFDTGEVYQQIDALGNTTRHSYDSAYAGAYSTQTCNALSQCVSGTYDLNTGLLTSFTNANATTQAKQPVAEVLERWWVVGRRRATER